MLICDSVDWCSGLIFSEIVFFTLTGGKSLAHRQVTCTVGKSLAPFVFIRRVAVIPDITDTFNPVSIS